MDADEEAVVVDGDGDFRNFNVLKIFFKNFLKAFLQNPRANQDFKFFQEQLEQIRTKLPLLDINFNVFCSEKCLIATRRFLEWVQMKIYYSSVTIRIRAALHVGRNLDSLSIIHIR